MKLHPHPAAHPNWPVLGFRLNSFSQSVEILKQRWKILKNLNWTNEYSELFASKCYWRIELGIISTACCRTLGGAWTLDFFDPCNSQVLAQIIKSHFLPTGFCHDLFDYLASLRWVCLLIQENYSMCYFWHYFRSEN